MNVYQASSATGPRQPPIRFAGWAVLRLLDAGTSGGPLDVRQFARVAQTVEAPQLAEHLPFRGRPGSAQRLLQPAAELLRVTAGLAIQVLASLCEPRIDARALEENAAQLCGESAGQLAAQQPVTRDVFVDLGLH